MEESKSLVKKETPPSFIEKLMLNSESLEQVKEVGNIIIKSGFCPDHFKTNNDAVGVVMCIEAGRQLGLTWMQSLSDMYPVKGRIGIMGAGARSLIFSSGVLDKWEETTEGEFPQDSYKHIVISKRKGLPGEFRTEFSVMDAKKAGLMSKDIYQRYGKRMLMWRAIGFHATDYYGDIMKGMKTVEELSDFDVIPGAGDTTIETEDGKKINITGGGKGKSAKMTDRVVDKIPDNKFGEVNKGNIQEAEVVETATQDIQYKDVEKSGRIAPITEENKEESPFKAEKGSVSYFDGKKVERDGEGNIINAEQPPAQTGKYSLKELEEMDTKELLKMVNEDTDMVEANDLIPGKNTNKKLRETLYAHQEGRLAAHVAPYMGNQGSNEPVIAPEAPQPGEIPINKEFDKQGPDVSKQIDDFLDPTKKVAPAQAGNKYNIAVPEYDKGDSREFSTVKTLFNKLMGVTPQITTVRYLELSEKLGLLKKYPDKEVFVKMATISEINDLLNSN